MNKKILPLVLAVSLCFSSLSFTSFAKESTDDPTDVQQHENMQENEEGKKGETADEIAENQTQKGTQSTLQIDNFIISPASEAKVDQNVELIAKSSGGNGKTEYRFYVIRNEEEIVLQNYSSRNSYLWKPFTPANYNVCVDARDQSGQTVTRQVSFKVTEDVLTITHFNPPEIAYCGEEIELKVDTSGERGKCTYQYYVIRDGQKIVLKNFSQDPMYKWKPFTAADYEVVAVVCDGNKRICESRAKVTVKQAEYSIDKLTVGNNVEVQSGKSAPISVDISTKGNVEKLKYRFYVIRNNEQILLQDFSMKNSYNWVPYTPAEYTVCVEAKDANGNIKFAKVNFKVKKSLLQVDNFTVNPKSETSLYGTVLLTANASRGTGTTKYRFYVIRDGEEIELQKYSAKNTYQWMPYTPAEYKVCVDVKDGTGVVLTETLDSYRVSKKPIELQNFQVPKDIYCGEKIKLDMNVYGGLKPYQCQYYVIRNGEKIILKDFSEKEEYIWEPYTPAAYEVVAVLRGADGEQTQKSVNVTVHEPIVKNIQLNVGNGSVAQSWQSVPLSVKYETMGDVGKLSYKYYVERNGKNIILYNSKTNSTYNWVPFTPAKYKVFVEITDGNEKKYTASREFEVVAQSVFIDHFTMSVSGSSYPNKPITLSAAGHGGKGTLKYKFYVIRNGSEIVLQDFSTKKSYQWVPFTEAQYTVCVAVMDERGLVATLTKSLSIKGKNGWYYENGYKFYYKNGVKQLDLDGILPKQSSYYIKVNRTTCSVTVYAKDGNNGYIIPVKRFACSVGLPSTPTPTGTFYTPNKYRWHTLMGPSYGQYCTRIVGGVLFHSVAGYNTTSYNLNARDYNKLGSPASHGCVRLCVRDAKWIYDNCVLGTKVTIYDSSDPGPLGKPATIKIPSWQNWDPTDPNI